MQVFIIEKCANTAAGLSAEIETRIKAIRCETLRTITTNNSKNTHI